MHILKERKANRLNGFDYASDNLYFVTTCVKDRERVLGSIHKGVMELNAYGHIASDQLSWLENQYAYVRIHAFVIMPDHVHAIVEINRGLIGRGREPIETARDVGTGGDVGTGRDLSLQSHHDPPPKIKSLSELMGVYKTTSSKHIRLAGLIAFEWQRSFHDRIIRDEHAYLNIVKYIEQNPAKWHP